MEFTTELEQKLEKIQKKYDLIGQDYNEYLDSLLYQDTLKYWDYIQLDTLLSLQKPKTNFPDEIVFIMYHQITELYFKLALREFEQIGEKTKIDALFFIERVTRINRYFEVLIKSFEIMINGMEKEQFLKFRMALAPASGFQSIQYRKIEIYSTDFVNLIHKDVRSKFSGNEPIEVLLERIYWKIGTHNINGTKTYTLIEFENHYKEELIQFGEKIRLKNLWQSYLRLSDEDQKNPTVIEVLKENDVNVNLYWPLVHYKSAVHYLKKDSNDVAGTGGTNWRKYLPPRFQKRIFYPKLWTEDEKNEWGKVWVEKVLA